MGLLVDGHWQDTWYETRDGRFERQDSLFRNWVTADGAPGPTGEGGFEAEPGRYHLFVSLACPWAHRTLIMRSLKRLQPMIGVSVTHWLMGEQGWSFEPGEGVIPDPVLGAGHLHQLYVAAVPHYTGRVTVPVLWDRQRAPSCPTRAPTSCACSTGVRRGGCRTRRLFPGGAAAGDRRGQRARLRHGQQRRVPRRLRHHAGRLRGSGGRAVLRRWTGWSSACRRSATCWATR